MRIQTALRLGALLLILGLVGAELALRRAGYGRRVVTVLDEELGWRRLPDQRVVTREGIEVAVNSRGYRDREWAPPGDERAEERLLRVAVLGNSVPAGNRTAIEDTWGRRLEERLRAMARDDERWDDALVMNFSGPAYGIEQMARIYRRDVRPFRPDVVIASVSVGSLHPLRPTRGERDWPLKRQLVSTALYDWFQREVVRTHGAGGFVEEEGLGPEERRQLERADQARRVLSEGPFSAEAEPLWESARARMADLASELTSRGAELMLLYMPRLDELDPSLPSPAQERWRAWAERTAGARCVDPRAALCAAMADLIEELRASGRGAAEVWQNRPGHEPPAELEHVDQAVFLVDDPEHLSPRGHAALAELLYDELAAWLPVR